MRSAIFCLGIILSSLASFGAYGLQITLSQTQLNGMLAAAFPITRQYDGFDVSFSNPSITLSARDDSVSIRTDIVAKHQGQLLHANGSIRGMIDYDSDNKVLNIVKPMLEEFRLIDNQITQAQQAIEIIKQSVGKNLPMILLLDFTRLDLGFFQAVPKKIDIIDEGITIDF